MTTPHDPNSGEQYNPADHALEARLAAHLRAQVTAPWDGETFWEQLAPRLEPRESLEANTVAPSTDTQVRRRGTTVIVPDDVPALSTQAGPYRASNARRPRHAINNLLAVAAVLALCLSAFALFHQLSIQQLGKSVLMQRGELAWRRVTLPPGVVLTNADGVTMTNGSGTPIISGAAKNSPTPNATLQVTPSNGNIAYICQMAGQANPRLWRTTDAGQRWSPLPDLPVSGSFDYCYLNVDANNPLTVIAGLVRDQRDNASRLSAFALFDDAAHWQSLDPSQSMQLVASWRNIYYRLGNLNPKTPATADPNGKPQDQPQQRIYESTDQMQTWHELNDAALIAENIATAEKTTGFGLIGAIALWVQPNTGELLAQTTDGVLWRSSDHGQTWTRILLPSLPPASELTPTPGEMLSEGGATDALAIVQLPTGNKPFTLCALVLDQTAIAYNVAPFYCSTDSGQSWTRRPRTAVEWGNGKPATFELPQLMLSDGTLLAWDVRTLSVFPGNNPSAAAAHVIGTIPTPLSPDNVPGGAASPIPGGAVLWQPHDPQTLYVATYYAP
ncbi:MAG TPA: sialidase family protein [Ktedonobacterales bacterium]|nr:sialidase family protein [Ktedonobacterales bacterium]